VHDNASRNSTMMHQMYSGNLIVSAQIRKSQTTLEMIICILIKRHSRYNSLQILYICKVCEDVCPMIISRIVKKNFDSFSKMRAYVRCKNPTVDIYNAIVNIFL